MKQTVTLEANLGYESADSFIRFLIDLGFSVEASHKGNDWTIKATKY